MRVVFGGARYHLSAYCLRARVICQSLGTPAWPLTMSATYVRMTDPVTSHNALTQSSVLSSIWRQRGLLVVSNQMLQTML